VYARQFQEVLGGQYGEITIAMQYGFQAWNMHIPGNCRDLLVGIEADSFGHVELLAIMIAQLLEKAPDADMQASVDFDPVMAAVIGGTDVQHAIVAGAGSGLSTAMATRGRAVITARGNLLADFTANANGEMQGRLQAARLYHMTDDKGVRDLLSFLIARDTMHQNQWIAAAAELRAEGVEDVPVPSNFPQSLEHGEVAYRYLNFSDGKLASTGSWAAGPTPNPDPRLYGTTPEPNLLDKAKASVKDIVGK